MLLLAGYGGTGLGYMGRVRLTCGIKKENGLVRQADFNLNGLNNAEGWGTGMVWMIFVEGRRSPRETQQPE